LIFQRFTSMHLDILASFANTLSLAEAFQPSQAYHEAGSA